MARETAYTDDEEEAEEPEEESDPAPMPAKKPALKRAPMPAPQKPVPQVVRFPVFESQAQQILYDTLIEMNRKLNKIDADLELMKSFLPKD